MVIDVETNVKTKGGIFMFPEEFSQFWAIYDSSFPVDEKRDKQTQRRLLTNNKYKIIPYYNNGKMVGFIALWILGDIVFLEHLAIKKEFRGKGYGTKILKDVKRRFPGRLVLEVEPPKDETTIRRIKFYKKAGFHLNEHHYVQPPLGRNKKPVTLKIMSYLNLIPSEEFDYLVRYIHNNIEHA